MTNPMFNPNYSGVTIQIANPTVNAGLPPQIYGQNICPQVCPAQPLTAGNMPALNLSGMANETIPAAQQGLPALSQQASQPASYPPQYYLNNYNYQSNPQKSPQDGNTQTTDSGIKTTADDGTALADTLDKNVEKETAEYPVTNEPEDLTKSQNIIDDLNARENALKAEEENKQKKNVVALTDEYIKSLENYLNNPNQEIRLMASKEILTRLDEDKSRFDDPALNALLNKMLQDPSKLIRIASLSAFNSQLASGNEYTVHLLQTIQQNPSSDKEDVLQSADILLKMSAGREIKEIPNPAVKEEKAEQPQK